MVVTGKKDTISSPSQTVQWFCLSRLAASPKTTKLKIPATPQTPRKIIRPVRLIEPPPKEQSVHGQASLDLPFQAFRDSQPKLSAVLTQHNVMVGRHVDEFKGRAALVAADRKRRDREFAWAGRIQKHYDGSHSLMAAG
jgi:hypothetical protein